NSPPSGWPQCALRADGPGAGDRGRTGSRRTAATPSPPGTPTNSRGPVTQKSARGSPTAVAPVPHNTRAAAPASSSHQAAGRGPRGIAPGPCTRPAPLTPASWQPPPPRLYVVVNVLHALDLQADHF